MGTGPTERREMAEIRFQRLFEAAKDGIVVIDAETQTVEDVNAFFLKLTSFQREDIVAKTATEVGELLRMPSLAMILADTWELRCIPVAMFSASLDDADVVRSYTQHANAYVRKPVDLESSLCIVRQIESFWLHTARLSA